MRSRKPDNKRKAKPRKEKAGSAKETLAPPIPGISLSAPSEELARKILTDVGWAERIEGYRYAPMAGDMRELIYSFRDATNLLGVDVAEPWSRTSGFFGYFDFNELQKWVGDVFGDKELADAIGEQIKEGSSLKEQIEDIKPLMVQRLRQCEEMLGENA